MVEIYDPDDDELEEDDDVVLDLEPDAAPEPVGVYDRPEQTTTGPSMGLILAIIAILVVLAVVAFLLI